MKTQGEGSIFRQKSAIEYIAKLEAEAKWFGGGSFDYLFMGEGVRFFSLVCFAVVQVLRRLRILPGHSLSLHTALSASPWISCAPCPLLPVCCAALS